MMKWLSKQVVSPLWDLKDRSIKLKELKRLELSQWQPAAVLAERQWRSLNALLRHAYDNSAYYTSIFRAHGLQPQNIKTPDDLLKIPLLTKKDVQNRTDDLISKQHCKATLRSSKTGGSTGVALKLYFDKSCEEMRNAAAIRSDRWANWDFGCRKASIWGNPPPTDTIKKWLRNTLYDRFLYLDTMNLNDASMTTFVRQCNRLEPEVIFGHSHSIYIFATFLAQNGMSIPAPAGIISTSMMLMPHEREVIEKVLRCKVTDRYGCEEVGLIACECEKHDGMHLNIDHLFIEFLKDDGSHASPGEEGKIVVTDLINYGMPMIRYQVEDVGILSTRQCFCGRGLPLMDKVTGRVADFLVHQDGSRVAGVSLVERTLTAVPGIEQMQIRQDTLDTIILNIVRMDTYDDNSKRLLTREFQQVFGDDINLDFNYIEKIPQERSGKYRFSICNVAH